MSAKVGEKAAEFELSDQYGDPWSLSRIVEEKKFTAIVFFRSADW
ncbi:peroxiredoxin family protein [Pirellulaceae bacterium]|nr:peroxiredoxin family protein [Pirellulaceae bacterium]